RLMSPVGRRRPICRDTGGFCDGCGWVRRDTSEVLLPTARCADTTSSFLRGSVITPMKNKATSDSSSRRNHEDANGCTRPADGGAGRTRPLGGERLLAAPGRGSVARTYVRDPSELSVFHLLAHGVTFESEFKFQAADLTTVPPASKQFAEEVLRSHNEYRRRHQAPPLKLSSKLSREATRYAESLASTRILKHSASRGSCGENLAWASYDQSGAYRGSSPSGRPASSPGSEFTHADVADRWYNEVKNYNYNRPGFSSGTGETPSRLASVTVRVTATRRTAHPSRSRRRRISHAAQMYRVREDASLL
ncbi:golgi-associated plant pathogenesis-related protein 1-like, partial [Scleropages formosus]